jgi:hypothetical protein
MRQAIRNSRCILVAGLAVAVCIFLAGYWIWISSEPPGVTAGNCKRLHVGMTFSHVKTLLGEEPKHKAHDTLHVSDSLICRWECGEMQVEIILSTDEKVLGGCWCTEKQFVWIGESPRFWERVLSWIKM